MRRSLALSAAFLLAAAAFVGMPNDGMAQNRSSKFTIVIHGGAGTISESMPESVKAQYYASLKKALKIGRNVLVNGGTSIEAVEKVLRYFETDPKFNAGIGAVYTSAGTHELDAAIMNGAMLGEAVVPNSVPTWRIFYRCMSISSKSLLSDLWEGPLRSPSRPTK